MKKHIDAWVNRTKRYRQMVDELNHINAVYIATATNNPKKFPKKPFLADDNEQKRDMTPEEMNNFMKSFTIRYKEKNG